MKIIPWEVSQSNIPSEVFQASYDQRYITLGYKYFQKQIAKCKFLTPYILSTEINKVPYVFNPLTNILLESNGELRYFGIFSRSFDIGRGTKEPFLCLRKGCWSFSEDIYSDMSKFINDHDFLFNQNVRINNVFWGKKESKKLLKYINELNTLITGGIKFLKDENSLLDADKVEVDSWIDDSSWKILYPPKVHTNIDLEEVILNIIAQCSEIEGINNYVPDSPIRISFENSILDWEVEVKNIQHAMTHREE